MREKEKELKRLKIEEDLYSDDALAPENEYSRKQNPLYQKPSKKLEKVPSKD